MEVLFMVNVPKRSIYLKNRAGPGIEPCGTPQKIKAETKKDLLDKVPS